MPATRLAIVNQKGGVAKTTTAVNLAANLAARGSKVLLVDYDPQGNATMALGLADLTEATGIFTSTEFTISQAELMRVGRRPFEFTPQRDVLGLSARGGCLDLVPAADELAFLENELILMQDIKASSRLLQRAIDEVENDYDYVIVDSGPTVGTLMMNVLAATKAAIIPVKLSPLSVPGAIKLRRHIEERLRFTLDPAIRVFGVLGTFMKETSHKPREVLGILHKIFGPAVFETVIHENQATDDASETGRPVILHNPSARGAIQYDKLTDEILARLGRA